MLLKIANGLNRRPSELLSEVDADKQIAVLRRDDRLCLMMNRETEMEHLVGMIPRNRLDVGRVRLETGDSIHFDPSVEHRWVAGRAKPATLTCFLMIPPRLQADLVSRLAAATSDGSQPESIDAAPDAVAELQ